MYSNTKVFSGGVKASRPVPKENTPIQKKFDLKASLSKKLPYKPHTGPLKPLAHMNMNTSIFTGPFPPPKAATENRVIKAKRFVSFFFFLNTIFMLLSFIQKFCWWLNLLLRITI